jgi:hypothetical protein
MMATDASFARSWLAIPAKRRSCWPTKSAARAAKVSRLAANGSAYQSGKYATSRYVRDHGVKASDTAKSNAAFRMSISTSTFTCGSYGERDPAPRTSAVMNGDYVVSRHGFRELAADDLVAQDALAGIQPAIVVEDYPDSRKEPSVLVLQYDRNARPIHVMWGVPNAYGRPAIFVTANGPHRSAVSGFQEAQRTMTRNSKEFIHQGKYCAEVPVELIDDATAWSPYLTPDDVRKLDTVRLALRRGDITEAAKHGKVFELTPVEAK